MKARNPETHPFPNEKEDLSRFDGDMVELVLLLPSPQAAALESAAHHQGLTTGQMARRIMQDFFGKFARPRYAEKG